MFASLKDINWEKYRTIKFQKSILSNRECFFAATLES